MSPIINSLDEKHDDSCVKKIKPLRKIFFIIILLGSLVLQCDRDIPGYI